MKKWLIYLLLAVGSALSLIQIIHSGIMALLWLYFGVMLLSTLITKWYAGEPNPSPFLQYVEHIAYISTLGLFLWYPLSWVVEYFG